MKTVKIFLDLAKAEFDETTYEYKWLLGTANTDIPHYIQLNNAIGNVVSIVMLDFNTTWVLSKMLGITTSYLDINVKELSTKFTTNINFRYKIQDTDYYLYYNTVVDKFRHMTATTLERKNELKFNPIQSLTSLTLSFYNNNIIKDRIAPYLLQISNMVQSGPITITLTFVKQVDYLSNYITSGGFRIKNFTTTDPVADAAVINAMTNNRFVKLTVTSPTTALFDDTPDISTLTGSIVYDPPPYIEFSISNECTIPIIIQYN